MSFRCLSSSLDLSKFSLGILTSWVQVLDLAAEQIQVLTHIARCVGIKTGPKIFYTSHLRDLLREGFTRFLKVKRKSIIYDDAVKAIFAFGLGASCFHGWWLWLHSTRSTSRVALFPLEKPWFVFLIHVILGIVVNSKCWSHTHILKATQAVDSAFSLNKSGKKCVNHGDKILRQNRMNLSKV